MRATCNQLVSPDSQTGTATVRHTVLKSVVEKDLCINFVGVFWDENSIAIAAAATSSFEFVLLAHSQFFSRCGIEIYNFRIHSVK